MNTFQITSSLDQVYPDIEDELCSKHTVLLNQVHKAFRQAFPMHPPTHYVVSKLLLELVRTQGSVITMGMEQGTVILLSGGEEGGAIHICGNFLQEDLVLEASGKTSKTPPSNDLECAIRSIVECATEDLSLNRINGGFIYCNVFDGVGDEKVRNSLLVGLFMAVLTVNDLVGEYSKEQLIAKLKSNHYLKGCDVERYFQGCGDRELMVGHSTLKLDTKYRFVFLSLRVIDQSFNYQSNHAEYGSIDLDSPNVAELFSKIEQIQKANLKETINQIKEEFKIKTYIFAHKYAIFLVESYRYAEVIGKISKMVHRIQQSKSPLQQQDGLVKRFGSSTKINHILFSSVPSTPLSILDPSSCLWFN